MDYKKIGEFITKLRREEKMTQERLAELLYVDRSTISKWEQGINNINIDVLTKISEIFNVTLNEIYVGERKNNKNISKLNVVITDAMNNNKKIKRYLISSLVLILILIVSFLGYYFINNYNSIKVYEINNSDSDININNGLLIISKDIFYIQLGNVESLNDKETNTIDLYYTLNNETVNLFYGDTTSCFYTSNYTDLKIKYSDIKKHLLKNLYLKVTYKNEEEKVIKLNLEQTYSNNKIYNNSNSKWLEQDEIEIEDIEIPAYIKENFTLDKENNYYYCETEINGVKIKQEYIYDMGTFVVFETRDKYSENYSYTYNDLSYSKYDSDTNILDCFSYDLSSNKCNSEKCDEEKIKYFLSEYYEKLSLK